MGFFPKSLYRLSCGRLESKSLPMGRTARTFLRIGPWVMMGLHCERRVVDIRPSASQTLRWGIYQETCQCDIGLFVGPQFIILRLPHIRAGLTRLSFVYWTRLALIYGLNCSRKLMILSYYLGLGFTNVPHKQCLWWVCRAWYSVEEWIPSPVRIISNLAHPRKEIITKKSIYSVKLLYFNQNSRKKIKSNTSSKIQKGD